MRVTKLKQPAAQCAKCPLVQASLSAVSSRFQWLNTWFSNHDAPPPSTSACSSCPFRSVCSASAADDIEDFAFRGSAKVQVSVSESPARGNVSGRQNVISFENKNQSGKVVLSNSNNGPVFGKAGVNSQRSLAPSSSHVASQLVPPPVTGFHRSTSAPVRSIQRPPCTIFGTFQPHVAGTPTRPHARSFGTGREFSFNRKYCSTPETPKMPERDLDGIYRRELPSSLVAFSSPEGRTRLKESMRDGMGDAFFELSEQFLTQVDPPVCGPATLAMVFNSLRHDPGKIWKGPWRWYNEDMLASCDVGLAGDRGNRGYTMYEFALVAECSGAHVQVLNATDSAEDLKKFRKTIKMLCGPHGLAAEARLDATGSAPPARLVCNFSRTYLDQTGSGHYSPIAAYHVDSDSVLIMDVARFKYPPFWVEVDRLWGAMKEIDPETGHSRGYFVISGQVPELGCEPSQCGCDLESVRVQLRDEPHSQFLEALEQAPLRHAVKSYTHYLRQQFARNPEEILKMIQAIPVSEEINEACYNFGQEFKMRSAAPGVRSVFDSFSQWRPQLSSLFYYGVNGVSPCFASKMDQHMKDAVLKEISTIEKVLSGKPMEHGLGCILGKPIVSQEDVDTTPSLRRASSGDSLN